MTAILRRKLSEGDAKGAEELVDAMISSAKSGDARNLQQIFDRIDGKVPDKHEHTGPEGGAIPIQFIDIVRPDGKR